MTTSPLRLRRILATMVLSALACVLLIVASPPRADASVQLVCDQYAHTAYWKNTTWNEPDHYVRTWLWSKSLQRWFGPSDWTFLKGDLDGFRTIDLGGIPAPAQASDAYATWVQYATYSPTAGWQYSQGWGSIAQKLPFPFDYEGRVGYWCQT